jgi:hypothetical protein
MSKQETSTPVVDADHMIHVLQELIDALDRRAPHVERIGEHQIAQDAENLRRRASQRMEELKRKRTSGAGDELQHDVMSDDGGPTGQ